MIGSIRRAAAALIVALIATNAPLLALAATPTLEEMREIGEALSGPAQDDPRLAAEYESVISLIESAESAGPRQASSLQDQAWSGLLELTDDIATLNVPTPEQVGFRLEPRFGRPDCPADQVADAEPRCMVSEWNSTRSTNFAPMKKKVYLRGSGEASQQARVTSSFVARDEGTQVAVIFSAEAFVEDPYRGEERQMYVRAMLDGQPTEPGDVIFATTNHRGTRAFIFTAEVEPGIHTVEMEWKVAAQTTGHLRAVSLVGVALGLELGLAVDSLVPILPDVPVIGSYVSRDVSLAVRTGTDVPKADGGLVVGTPAEAAPLQKAGGGWEDIPGLGGWIHVPEYGFVTASMSAEADAEGGKAIAVRALIDGVPAMPSDVVFARGEDPQAQMMTFGTGNLAAGWHQVGFQWAVEGGGSAQMGDRSFMLSSFPYAGSGEAFVAAPSGPSVMNVPGAVTLLDHMSAWIDIPTRGNGEAAVHFSAEVSANSPAEVGFHLYVDGWPVADSEVALTQGTDAPDLRSWTFGVKDLTPGAHRVDVYWSTPQGVVAFAGDRTLAVVSEVGFVPDLAEAPRFGGGHIGVDYDYIPGVEPLIGSRNVLAILWDPRACDVEVEIDEYANENPEPPPPCKDQDDLSVGDVEGALFTGNVGRNVREQVEAMSGDRFTLVDAGVLGWYEASEPWAYYYEHPGGCIDGFDNGSSALVADAVRLSDPEVNYADYDVNQDGEVDPQELAIIVVVPRATETGSSIARLYGSNCGGSTPLELDGVQLPQSIVKWNTSLATNTQYTTATHELMHLLGGADDLYLSFDVSTFPRQMSLMSSNSGTTTQLDPLYKLAFGWVTPTIIEFDGFYDLDPVGLSHSVFVLPRYNHEGFEDEYLILESRQEGLGGPAYDWNIPDSGIGVWHVVSDPAHNVLAPIGTHQTQWDASHASSGHPASQGQMGRNGIRLIRNFQGTDANGTAQFDSKDQSLWVQGDPDLVSAGCPMVHGPMVLATLTWADCQPSGYGVRFVTPEGQPMTVEVDVP